MIKIRELRIRYELPTASGGTVIHGIVCSFQTLAVRIREIKEVGYRVVGVDERFHDEKERVPLDEGWVEVAKL